MNNLRIGVFALVIAVLGGWHSLLTAAPNLAVTTLPDGSIKLTGDSSEGGIFGKSVALNGDTAVVGAPFEDEDRGAVYVFTRDEMGNWSRQAKLEADDAASFDSFGWSVALDGDAVLIGAYGDEDGSGSAYAFTRDGNDNWSQQAKLRADDAASGDLFGTSVALDGDTAVIGADGVDGNGESSGAAYVFTRDGDDNWSQQKTLTADTPAEFDYFGDDVAIDGDTIVIGAYGDDEGKQDSGAVYVFTRDESDNWTRQAKLKPDDAENFDNFGLSVAIDGDTVVAGEPFNLDGEAAYVFTRDESDNWTQQAKLSVSQTPSAFFGEAVAVDGDAIVVGAPDTANRVGMRDGAAYTFTRDGAGNWTSQAQFLAADFPLTNAFGDAVAVDGDTVLIGAPVRDTAYIYTVPFSLIRLDVNADGAITPSDAVYVVNRVGTDDLSADVNGDGLITTADFNVVITELGTTIP